MKMFPIMLTPDYQGDDKKRGSIKAAIAGGSLYVAVQAPWEMMIAHEKQALKNHSQTIQRLSERGGLSACEAVAVIEDREYSRLPLVTANEELCRHLRNWMAGIASNSTPAT